MQRPVHTTKALLRGKRLKAAKRQIRERVVVGWSETGLDGSPQRVQTPDEYFAAQLRHAGVVIEQRVYPTLKKGSSVRSTSGSYIRVPQYLLRNTGQNGKRGRVALYENLRSQITLRSAEPDPVVEVPISGRTIYLHSFPSRLLQKLWQLSVQPTLEHIFLPACCAYRRAPNTMIDAVYRVRRCLRRGCMWSVKLDIRRCFASITYDLVESVLDQQFAWMSRDLRDLTLWFLRPWVWRRPDHPGRCGAEEERAPRFSPPPGHLLEGSVIAPILANMVLHQVLDVPFTERWGGDVTLFRYSDDLLLLGRAPLALAAARDHAIELLWRAQLAVHPDLAEDPASGKGHKQPLNLLSSRDQFLGYEIHGKQIRTPDEVISEGIEELVLLRTNPALFRSFFYQLCNRLRGDTHAQCERRLDYIERQLKRREPVAARQIRWLRDRRPTETGWVEEDPPEIETAYENGSAHPADSTRRNRLRKQCIA